MLPGGRERGPRARRGGAEPGPPGGRAGCGLQGPGERAGARPSGAAERPARERACRQGVAPRLPEPQLGPRLSASSSSSSGASWGMRSWPPGAPGSWSLEPSRCRYGSFVRYLLVAPLRSLHRPPNPPTPARGTPRGDSWVRYDSASFGQDAEGGT